MLNHVIFIYWYTAFFMQAHMITPVSHKVMPAGSNAVYFGKSWNVALVIFAHSWNTEE